MEADIGNPIDYDPNMNDETTKREEEPPYYYFPPQPQAPPVQPVKTSDLFANIEKSTWIIAFAVFLLGFFMGKTMQPVILRYA